MIRIGIELNHVVRNINKQILKYYNKDIDPSLDLDEINENDDVFKVCKFNSVADKNSFIYIDYPYEIFASAKPMSKDLPTTFNNWLANLSNYEDDEVEVFFYSLNEEYLTIQSTYFFLSKIGTRVRKVIFPRDLNEIANQMDVVVTASKETIDKLGNDVYKILINTGFNSECNDLVNNVYNSLEDAVKDENLLDTLHKFVIEKENRKDEQTN